MLAHTHTHTHPDTCKGRSTVRQSREFWSTSCRVSPPAAELYLSAVLRKKMPLSVLLIRMGIKDNNLERLRARTTLTLIPVFKFPSLTALIVCNV